jgi:DNA transposition AAA+ family ATPase
MEMVMRDCFIPTQNYQKAAALCEELMGPALGVEMAAITGRAGRGKTTVAERIYATNKNTVYVLYHEDWSYSELLRDITFRLCGTRPRYRQICFEMIQNEMARQRRIIMVDEADRMNVKCLNVLRNIHDVCKVPVLLIGEDDLKRKMEKENRLISRLRSTLLFDPVNQADVVVFFKSALGQPITPEMAGRLLMHSGGDFRNVLTDAVAIERMMKASGVDRVMDRIVDAVCSNGKK